MLFFIRSNNSLYLLSHSLFVGWGAVCACMVSRLRNHGRLYVLSPPHPCGVRMWVRKEGCTSGAVTQFLSLSNYIEIAVQHIIKMPKQWIYRQHWWKQFRYRQGVNNFVSLTVQLNYHWNFQKTHYPEISVQSPGSNRASASRLQRLFKRNRLCVLSPTPHYGRRDEESGKREPRGRKPKGRGESAFGAPSSLPLGCLPRS